MLIFPFRFELQMMASCTLCVGFKMGMGPPLVFPKCIPWVQVWLGILAHHGTLCTHTKVLQMGKLQWVIFTIHYFYSHFFPSPPLFFWYCNGFGVVAILGMLSHKYHYYFLILAVQLLTYIVSYFWVHQLLISCDLY